MGSETFKRAADALVALRKLPGGDSYVNALAIRVVTALDRGGDWNWDEIMQDPKIWEVAKVDAREAREAFQGLIALCGPGNSPSTEFLVGNRVGLSFQGFVGGESANLRLEKSADELGWGPFSTYVVTEGSQDLVGRRVVRRQSKSPGRRPDETGSNDALLLAQPERAAFLEVAEYDGLPNKYAQLGKLLKMKEEQEADTDGGAMDINFVDPEAFKPLEDPKIREAVRFAERLKNLPNDGSRVSERFNRVMETPIMQEVAAIIDKSSDLRELAECLKPYRDRFYSAARSARSGPGESADEPEVTVIDFELDIFQAVGVLVVVVALAFGAFNAIRSALTPAGPGDLQAQQQSLPTYSLRGDPSAAASPSGSTMYSLKGDPSSAPPS